VFRKALLVLYALTLTIHIPLNSDALVLIRPFSSTSYYFESNRHTQVEDLETITINPYLDEKDLTLVSENNDFILYVDETILSIYVYQKSTQYMWSSTINKDYNALDDEDNPLYPDLYDNENRGLRSTLWRQKIDSPLWIGYFTSSQDNPQYREEHLFDHSRSSFTLTLNQQGFKAFLYFGISNISMMLSVSLHEQGITYEILEDSIQELGSPILGKVSIYPFFGAAKQYEIPGYTMIPDGIGALIRFDKTSFTSIYEKPFYGQDFSVSPPHLNIGNTYVEHALSANTYGVVHGVDQQGYLKIVSGTPEYASLVVYPAGFITDFNFSYTSYTLRSNYRQPLNQSQTNSILRVQQALNPIHMKEDIIFLAGDQANYMGMVKVYQAYLLNRGDLNTFTSHDSTMHLDILLSESKQAFIGRDTFVMTRITDVIDMVTSLQDQGIRHIQITLRGTSSQGYSNTTLASLPLGNHVGSQDDYQRLLDMDFVRVYLYVEPMKAYTSTRFSNRFDVSLGRNSLPYENVDTFGLYHYIHPETYLSQMEAIIDKALDIGFDGVLFDQVGHTLYSSFGANPYSRRDAKDSVSELLKGQGVIKGLDFSFQASYVSDMVLDHSLHMKFSDTVPFIPYVLHPYKYVFSQPFNLYASSQLDILRLLDFHILPTYFLTQESAIQLLDTPSSYYVSTQFLLWEETIVGHYHMIHDLLTSLQGSHIVSRTVLEPGVMLITYDTHDMLYINYLSETKTHNGVTLEPQKATFIGGQL